MKEPLKMIKMIDTIKTRNGDPILEIIGTELAKHGFNIGDFVNISLSDNEIIISKNEQTEKLQQMNSVNPSIEKLVKEFGLSFDA